MFFFFLMSFWCRFCYWRLVHLILYAMRGQGIVTNAFSDTYHKGLPVQDSVKLAVGQCMLHHFQYSLVHTCK